MAVAQFTFEAKDEDELGLQKGDKVLVLDAGKVLQFDTPSALLNRHFGDPQVNRDDFDTRFSALQSKLAAVSEPNEDLANEFAALVAQTGRQCARQLWLMANQKASIWGSDPDANVSPDIVS